MLHKNNNNNNKGDNNVLESHLEKLAGTFRVISIHRTLMGPSIR